MKTVILVLLLALSVTSYSANGALFKCMKDGETTYQEGPCEAASNSTTMEVKREKAVNGCYQATFPPWETGKGTTEIFQIRTTSSGDIEMLGANVNSADKRRSIETIPMKHATRDELQQLSNASGLLLRDGVSMAGDQNITPNYRPVGIYMGKDKAGNEIVFAYFFFSSALAKQVACP